VFEWRWKEDIPDDQDRRRETDCDQGVFIHGDDVNGDWQDGPELDRLRRDEKGDI
jgi:hypothetical protein